MTVPSQNGHWCMRRTVSIGDRIGNLEFVDQRQKRRLLQVLPNVTAASGHIANVRTWASFDVLCGGVQSVARDRVEVWASPMESSHVVSGNGLSRSNH